MLNKVEGVHFKWRGCVSNGGGAFQLEGVRFKWRGCVSYGGGAFQLEGVRFIWRSIRGSKVAAVHLRMRIPARTYLT